MFKMLSSVLKRLFGNYNQWLVSVSWCATTFQICSRAYRVSGTKSYGPAHRTTVIKAVQLADAPRIITIVYISGIILVHFERFSFDFRLSIKPAVGFSSTPTQHTAVGMNVSLYFKPPIGRLKRRNQKT